MNTIYKNLLKDVLDYSPCSTQIYTDDSKTNTVVGIKIIHNDSSLSYRLLDHNRIYIVKYIALLEGDKLAIQFPDPINNICTNSLSVLNILKYNCY